MVHLVALPGESGKKILKTTSFRPERGGSAAFAPVTLLRGDTVHFRGILDDLSNNRALLADQQSRDLLNDHQAALSKLHLTVGVKELSGFDVLLLLKEQMAADLVAQQGDEGKCDLCA